MDQDARPKDCETVCHIGSTMGIASCQASLGRFEATCGQQIVSATPKVREDKASNQEKQLLELFCHVLHGQFRTQVGTVHSDILDDID